MLGKVSNCREQQFRVERILCRKKLNNSPSLYQQLIHKITHQSVCANNRRVNMQYVSVVKFLSGLVTQTVVTVESRHMHFKLSYAELFFLFILVSLSLLCVCTCTSACLDTRMPLDIFLSTAEMFFTVLVDQRLCFCHAGSN